MYNPKSCGHLLALVSSLISLGTASTSYKCNDLSAASAGLTPNIECMATYIGMLMQFEGCDGMAYIPPLTIVTKSSPSSACTVQLYSEDKIYHVVPASALLASFAQLTSRCLDGYFVWNGIPRIGGSIYVDLPGSNERRDSNFRRVKNRATLSDDAAVNNTVSERSNTNSCVNPGGRQVAAVIGQWGVRCIQELAISALGMDPDTERHIVTEVTEAIGEELSNVYGTASNAFQSSTTMLFTNDAEVVATIWVAPMDPGYPTWAHVASVFSQLAIKSAVYDMITDMRDKELTNGVYNMIDSGDNTVLRVMMSLYKGTDAPFPPT